MFHQKFLSTSLFISIVHTNLGDLLLSDGQPDFPSTCVQLLDGEVFLLHYGYRSIVGKLCEDLGDVRTPLVQKVSLSAFLLFLHLF